MIFTARIRRGSAIYHEWREKNRLGGPVAGIMFRWVPGHSYVSDVLTDEQVVAAMQHSDIQVESTEIGPPEPAVSTEPPVQAIPAVRSGRKPARDER